MSRSIWKGPFVDPSLIKKVEKLKGQTNISFQEGKRGNSLCQDQFGKDLSLTQV